MPRKGSGKGDPQHMATLVGREKAYELRLSGMSYSAIGREIGVDASTAHRYVMTEMDRIRPNREQVEKVREQEIDRLDRMLEGIWKKASNGDLAALDRVVRLMERRAKFLGSDAPAETKNHLTGGIGVTITPEDRAEALARLRAMERAGVLSGDGDDGTGRSETDVCAGA